MKGVGGRERARERETAIEREGGREGVSTNHAQMRIRKIAKERESQIEGDRRQQRQRGKLMNSGWMEG